jgi:hypothetical protein
MLDVGVHRGVNVSDYHNDPAPEPSLSQTIAKVLLSQSPLHAWNAHPRLCPTHAPDNDPQFDLGTVAHQLLLGRGKGLVVVDAADWRTKAAREQRDAVLSAGQTPVLAHIFQRAQNMVGVAKMHLGTMGIHWEGWDDSEVACIWREPVKISKTQRMQVWFRTLIDRLDTRPDAMFGRVYDYKTTRVSASPHQLPSYMVHQGWDIQAAMHVRALKALLPKRTFAPPMYIVQEAYHPYAITVCQLSDDVLRFGEQRLSQAAMIWARCMLRDRWPTYGDGEAITLSYPDWAVREREYDAAVAELEGAAHTMREATA